MSVKDYIIVFVVVALAILVVYYYKASENFSREINNLQKQNELLQDSIKIKKTKIKEFKNEVSRLDSLYDEQEDNVDSIKTAKEYEIERVDNYSNDSLLKFFTERYNSTFKK